MLEALEWPCNIIKIVLSKYFWLHQQKSSGKVCKMTTSDIPQCCGWVKVKTKNLPCNIMILKIFMDCNFKVNLNGLSNDGLHFEDSLW